MVQVLPGVPSFGTKLAETLGNAIGNVGQGIVQGNVNQKDNDLLAKIRPDSSPIDIFQIYSQLSNDRRKSLETGVNQLIKSQFASQEAKQKEEATETKELEQLGAEKKEFENIFKRLKEGTPYVGGNYGFFTPKTAFKDFPWSEAAKRRKQIEISAFQLERYARKEHTKGPLQAEVFNALLDRLPNPDMTEAEYTGVVEEWENAINNLAKFDKLNKSKYFKNTNRVTMRAPNGEDVPMDKENIAEAISRGWKIQ